MNNNYIELTNVTKLYGRSAALNNVNLVLQPGHIVGLLGPNGSGKSSIFEAIIFALFSKNDL